MTAQRTPKAEMGYKKRRKPAPKGKMKLGKKKPQDMSKDTGMNYADIIKKVVGMKKSKGSGG